MSNIFTKVKDYVDKPNRNTFDLSYQNNLTMEFGKLYPVFCKEVIPGDSMRIKPTFGLRFMPLVFPVQTRMQANLHFFYVRNRNLWKDWPDFIGRTKQNLVLPFLSPSVAKKVCKTRGLGDYLGIPTTLAGLYGANVVDTAEHLYHKEGVGLFSYRSSTDGFVNGLSFENMKFSEIETETEGNYVASTNVESSFGCATSILTERIEPMISVSYRKCNLPREVGEVDPVTVTEDLITVDPFPNPGPSSTPATLYCSVYVEDGDDFIPIFMIHIERPFKGQEERIKTYQLDLSRTSVDQYGTTTTYTPADLRGSMEHQTTFEEVLDYIMNNGLRYRLLFWNYGAECYQANEVMYNSCMFNPTVAQNQDPADGEPINNAAFGITKIVLPLENAGVRDLSSLDDSFNPYAQGDIKVSALPFRAYESIYNAFYRNQFNDPFTINGVKEFNKFITNDEGGEDTVDYDLYKRNYEQDFLTSAKQSPVDGDITPLVGVSGTGTFTFQNADGTQVNITPKFAEDGTTIIGLETVEGTPENTSSIRRLMDMASVGISINDFRNVNALQRWLETNLRRGYRYKDQLLSHFGVEAKFDVLDMPEFIGGMSEPVMVNQINQSVDQTDNSSGLGDFSKVLGSFAGQASVLAQSKHNVEKYCDEHGFIIGILSITPVPNYSQLLPKFFLKNNVLDYYFPEFGHIGNQPIPYSEVCPLQSYASAVAGGDEKLTDVFGYQRAWYDYLASVDEVHGDFRTSLEGFLINRVFDARPELGKDFLEVDPDNMSNPFSVTDKTDKILGQVYFDVTAQRPIPKFGIPRLE